MSLINYYELLGLTAEMTLEDIQERIKKLQIKYSPDNQKVQIADPIGDKMIKDVNNAKEVFKSQESKDNYDKALELQSEVKTQDSPAKKKTFKKVVGLVVGFVADKTKKFYTRNQEEINKIAGNTIEDTVNWAIGKFAKGAKPDDSGVADNAETNAPDVPKNRTSDSENDK